MEYPKTFSAQKWSKMEGLELIKPHKVTLFILHCIILKIGINVVLHNYFSFLASNYRNHQINLRIRFMPRKAKFEESITCYSRKAHFVLKNHFFTPRNNLFPTFWAFWIQKYHIILLAQTNFARINLMIAVVPPLIPPTYRLWCFNSMY